jgi:hypothetical protein
MRCGKSPKTSEMNTQIWGSYRSFSQHWDSLIWRWKSGRGLPQSKTLARRSAANVNAKRLGVLQPSGALSARTNMCQCQHEPLYHEEIARPFLPDNASLSAHNESLRTHTGSLRGDNGSLCSRNGSLSADNRPLRACNDALRGRNGTSLVVFLAVCHCE